MSKNILLVLVLMMAANFIYWGCTEDKTYKPDGLIDNNIILYDDQIMHPEEKSFKDIIKNDTLLSQKYIEGKSYTSKIVKQKIAEGVLRYSLVTAENFPEFYDDAKTISKKLGLGVPNYIFVKQNSELGATTIAADTNEYVMFVHSSIFSLMTREERKVLLAHELTHARLLHARIAVMLKLLNDESFDYLMHKKEMSVNQLFRFFEFSADRGSYLSSNVNEEIFIKTIMRFASGVSESDAVQNIESYINQIDMYLDLGLSTSDLEKYYAQMPEKKQDNPFPIIKAMEIRKFINELKMIQAKP
jgi:hypothetical protein